VLPLPKNRVVLPSTCKEQILSCKDKFYLGRNTVQQIKTCIIRNPYLRDFICNLEIMYFILLTNFIDENNNFFIIFCKLFVKYGCHHMLIFLIINVMYFILNLLTGWGMKKKIYRERGVELYVEHSMQNRAWRMLRRVKEIGNSIV
jgi:hypothetical protein